MSDDLKISIHKDYVLVETEILDLKEIREQMQKQEDIEHINLVDEKNVIHDKANNVIEYMIKFTNLDTEEEGFLVEDIGIGTVVTQKWSDLDEVTERWKFIQKTVPKNVKVEIIAEETVELRIKNIELDEAPPVMEIESSED